jgi:hypothetical protein
MLILLVWRDVVAGVEGSGVQREVLLDRIRIIPTSIAGKTLLIQISSFASTIKRAKKYANLNLQIGRSNRNNANLAKQRKMQL